MKLKDILKNSATPSTLNYNEVILKGRVSQHDDDGFFRLYPSENNHFYFILDQDDVIENPEKLEKYDASNLGFSSGEVYLVKVHTHAIIYQVNVNIISAGAYSTSLSDESIIVSEEEPEILKHDKCPARA